MGDQNDAWHDWRRQGLGASDIASAVTNSYGGAVAVVADKLGLNGREIDPEDAERGHSWEARIADIVHASHGLYTFGEQTLAEHPLHPTHRATLDGLLDPRPEVPSLDDIDTVLELKTSRSVVAPKWWSYTVQTQWQMWVTGATSALIAVAVINTTEPEAHRQLRDVRYRWVDRDDFTIDLLVDVADRLWAHVQAGTLPDPVDGSTLDIIKEAHGHADPDQNPAAIARLDNVETAIEERERLKEVATQAGDEANRLESRLRVAMGEATEAKTTSGRWRVRCGQPVQRFTAESEAEALDEYPDYGATVEVLGETVTVFNRARFKADHPDAYQQFKKPTSDRRLTIKEMKR